MYVWRLRPAAAAAFCPFAGLLAVGLLSGCTQSLASVIVTAPNRLNPLVSDNNPLPTVERLAGADQSFRVAVGPPDATLSVSIIEPKDGQTPRGTILVLHGILDRSLWMMGAANQLAGAGYRAVLVDLRGRGRSTGDFLTYGLQEAPDLSQVLDDLEARGLAAGPIGAYGLSYGATTAIHFAGHDPRVQAVVAVAPFSALRTEIPQYARTAAPGLGAAIPDSVYQDAIDEAGRRGDFDPELADAALAVRRTKAPVLLIHGRNDWLVPPEHSARIKQAAGGPCELILLPGLGHIGIWFDPGGQASRHAREWFGRYLAPATD